MTDYQNQQPQDILHTPQRSLPNATTVLVLGILSIVICFICGIIALSMASGDKRLYQQAPEQYSVSSYDLLKAGRVCAIIGLCIQGFVILLYAGIAIFAVSIGAFNN